MSDVLKGINAYVAPISIDRLPQELQDIIGEELSEKVKSANLELIAEIEAELAAQDDGYYRSYKAAVKDFRTILATKRGEIEDGVV